MSSKPAPNPHVLSFSKLKSIVENAPGEILAGILPEESVNLFVGESGQGKTPFLMQLALSIACGLPFLDIPTRQTPVLWVDYENGQSQVMNLLEALCEYLHIPTPPDSFALVHQPPSETIVRDAIRSHRPGLVIIDALRGYNPAAESTNSDGGTLIAKLQHVAKELHTSFLFIHHLKKPDTKNPPPTLLNAPTMMDWLLQCSGARALVNQANVRIGFSEDTSPGSDSIILRGHYKLRGEFGPYFIGRQYDDAGVAIGYKRQIGVELMPQSYRDSYHKLPTDFGFSDCKRILNKSQSSTANFLKRCMGAGVLIHTGQHKTARYTKVLA